MEYTVNPTSVFIDTLTIHEKYRHQGLIRTILKKLILIYKMDIYLLSWITLVPMYLHLGFEDLGEDMDGYHEMKLKIDNKL